MTDYRNFTPTNINFSNQGQNFQAGYPSNQPEAPKRQRRKSCLSCLSCFSNLIVITLFIFVVIGVYFIAPGDFSVLILGIDYAPHQSFVGRSDTMIMTTFDPLEPYVGMVSVPRDLWVTIPGVGENRINTAHFFAEANQAGSGPLAAIDTIEANTGIKMEYYFRIRFDGLTEIVDAMGGVEIDLSESLGGYQPGHYVLNGTKALAFARHRAGSDDFFRMKQGQLLIKAMIKQMLSPYKLSTIPGVVKAVFNTADTNIPFWQWPRLVFAVIRVGLDNIDNKVIDRTMVTPYTTDQGASVLLPNWSSILPELDKIFNR